MATLLGKEVSQHLQAFDVIGIASEHLLEKVDFKIDLRSLQKLLQPARGDVGERFLTSGFFIGHNKFSQPFCASRDPVRIDEGARRWNLLAKFLGHVFSQLTGTHE